MKVGLISSGLYNNSPRAINNNSEENYNSKGLNNNSNPSFGLVSRSPAKMLAIPFIILLGFASLLTGIVGNDAQIKGLEKFIKDNGGKAADQIKGPLAKQRTFLTDAVNAGEVAVKNGIKGVSKGDYWKNLSKFLTTKKH